MRGGKKKVSHPVSNRRPNDREACALPIALHKTLQQTFRMLCYIWSSMYEFTHTDIQTDRQTQVVTYIVASAMKLIATKIKFLDPDCYPDHPQNLISSSSSHFRYFLKISSKSVQYANKNVARTIKWKIRMLQPNRIAGFEVTACVLFCTFFNAFERHSVCKVSTTQPEKASNFNKWKNHFWLQIKFTCKTF